jgi:UDPglucose--hexose-1-phosphate uridylyltransferase
MSEWRRSPVSGEWYVIAPERVHPEALRSGQPPGRSAASSLCVLCLGAPLDGRAALYTEFAADGRWAVRVVPAHRPALRVEDGGVSEARGRQRVAGPGLGAHEVVVESPDHLLSLYDYGPSEFARVLRAWRARMHDLAGDRRLLVVVPRRSEGGGRSHPHSELLGLPLVPPVLERKLFIAAEHRHQQGACLFCALAAEAGERLVARDGESVAFTPWAPRSPFECWVMPSLHDARFDRTSDQRLEEVARLLAFSVGRLATVLERPRMTLWLHSAPLQEGERDDFHWHVELHPEIGGIDTAWADAAGVAVNPVAPELAAQWLREGTDEGSSS